MIAVEFAIQGPPDSPPALPEESHRRYGPLENLWRYNLSRRWRLVYTVCRDAGVTLVVLEWFSHGEHERRLGY